MLTIWALSLRSVSDPHPWYGRRPRDTVTITVDFEFTDHLCSLGRVQRRTSGRKHVSHTPGVTPRTSRHRWLCPLRRIRWPSFFCLKSLRVFLVRTRSHRGPRVDREEVDEKVTLVRVVEGDVRRKTGGTSTRTLFWLVYFCDRYSYLRDQSELVSSLSTITWPRENDAFTQCGISDRRHRSMPLTSFWVPGETSLPLEPTTGPFPLLPRSGDYFLRSVSSENDIDREGEREKFW